MPKSRRGLPPGLALFLLAPAFGELLSAHQAPAEFFNPIALVIFSLPYGAGALVCRELMIRWGKGAMSLLLLGLAYGIYEEAVVVRSPFNPRWDELGPLAEYGYAWGVNWSWTFMVLHFHMLISIFASVMLAEILYPARRREQWVGNRTLGLCAAYLALWLPLGWWMTDFIPPMLHYSLSFIAIIVLAAAARMAPSGQSATPRLLESTGAVTSGGPPIVFFLIGAFNMFAGFLGVFLPAESGWPPMPVMMFALCLMEIVTLYAAWRLSGRGLRWNDRHRLAFVCGLLSFFLLFGAIKDVEEGFQGYSIAAGLAVIALVMLAHHVSCRVRT